MQELTPSPPAAPRASQRVRRPTERSRIEKTTATPRRRSPFTHRPRWSRPSDHTASQLARQLLALSEEEVEEEVQDNPSPTASIPYEAPMVIEDDKIEDKQQQQHYQPAEQEPIPCSISIHLHTVKGPFWADTINIDDNTPVLSVLRSKWELKIDGYLAKRYRKRLEEDVELQATIDVRGAKASWRTQIEHDSQFPGIILPQIEQYRKQKKQEIKVILEGKYDSVEIPEVISLDQHTSDDNTAPSSTQRPKKPHRKNSQRITATVKHKQARYIDTEMEAILESKARDLIKQYKCNVMSCRNYQRLCYDCAGEHFILDAQDIADWNVDIGKGIATVEDLSPRLLKNLVRREKGPRKQPQPQPQ